MTYIYVYWKECEIISTKIYFKSQKYTRKLLTQIMTTINIQLYIFKEA